MMIDSLMLVIIAYIISFIIGLSSLFVFQYKLFQLNHIKSTFNIMIRHTILSSICTIANLLNAIFNILSIYYIISVHHFSTYLEILHYYVISFVYIYLFILEHHYIKNICVIKVMKNVNNII